MKSVRNGLAGAALLAGAAILQPVPQECFWTGIAWTCWTHPLFPGVTPVPEANPYWRSIQNWGGPGWRFYGWQSM